MWTKLTRLIVGLKSEWKYLPTGVYQSVIVMEEIFLNSQIKWHKLFVNLFFLANFNSNSNSNSKNFNSNSNSIPKISIPIQLFFQTSNSNSNSGIGIDHQFQFRNWIDPMSGLHDETTVKWLIIDDDLFGEIGEFKKFAKINLRQITISQFLAIQVMEIVKFILCQIVIKTAKYNSWFPFYSSWWLV